MEADGLRKQKQTSLLKIFVCLSSIPVTMSEFFSTEQAQISYLESQLKVDDLYIPIGWETLGFTAFIIFCTFVASLMSWKRFLFQFLNVNVKYEANTGGSIARITEQGCHLNPKRKCVCVCGERGSA